MEAAASGRTPTLLLASCQREPKWQKRSLDLRILPPLRQAQCRLRLEQGSPEPALSEVEGAEMPRARIQLDEERLPCRTHRRLTHKSGNRIPLLWMNFRSGVWNFRQSHVFMENRVRILFSCLFAPDSLDVDWCCCQGFVAADLPTFSLDGNCFSF